MMDSPSYLQRTLDYFKSMASGLRLLINSPGAFSEKLENESRKHQEEKQQLENDLAELSEKLETESRVHQGTKKDLEIALKKWKDESKNYQATQTRLGLVSSILAASPEEHPKCRAFQKFFHDGFLPFANEANQYAGQAEAILRLQAVEEELRLIASVPVFQKKSVVAVAGGFSSGKSSLISSFFDPRYPVRLPIAIKPSTAIPTYIAHSDVISISGFPAHGGNFKVQPELFGQMQHEFLKSLGFDIRRILPFIMVETPWHANREHLCFIDTPGYNPASASGAVGQDESTTREALKQADALLWVLGVDANGEISLDDLDYINNYCNGLPLFIILNKADTRPLSQVKEVLEQIGSTLDAYGIEYSGISAYSSTNRKEYACIGSSLEEVLDSWNQPQLREKRLSQETISVLDEYIQSFENEIKKRKEQKKEFKALRLDLDELGLFDETEENNWVNKNRNNIFGQILSRFMKEVNVETIDHDEIERRNKIKEKVLDRLQAFNRFFSTEDLEKQMNKAKQLREEAIRLFSAPWDADYPLSPQTAGTEIDTPPDFDNQELVQVETRRHSTNSTQT